MTARKTPMFSFFKAPITNKSPYRQITLRDAYLYISSDYAKDRTLRLRPIEDKEANRKFKSASFDFVTFSGSFTRRNEAELIEHSGYLVLDFDHLEDVQAVKAQLLKDPYFETQLLFVSPNGNGLKWVIEINVTGQYTHGEYFDAVSNYIRSTHGIGVDKSGRDVCRVCFLGWDPDAYVHPRFLFIKKKHQYDL
ncbi:BT4734/BF3469 family protein [Gaoshiqia sediminis]|uniref:BT4734-like N-terminal domain-containing protein n=1 Tax=Gaoshiqia sediminis TaxID=2986998 RepID=A0AA42CAG9_9BACT|nr:BT4734/BF3469 family protein [Gaoshiqia sediminis]MCW0483500.1 hypothetical protein [Gaoshiqia sediminis]